MKPDRAAYRISMEWSLQTEKAPKIMLAGTEGKLLDFQVLRRVYIRVTYHNNNSI